MPVDYRAVTRVNTLRRRFIEAEEFEKELSALLNTGWSLASSGLSNERWYAVLIKQTVESYSTGEDE